MSDYNENNSQAPKRIPGALDDSKLRLSAEAVNGSRRKPNLRVNLWENNPRIEVRTGVENDKNYGLISAALDLPVFFQVLDLIREACEQTQKWHVKITNQKFKFIRGQRSEEPLDDTYIVIGRTEQGVIYISILAYDKDRPRIKFDFLPSNFHKFTNADGTPYDQGKLSQSHAKAWASVMSELIPHFFATNYEYIDYQARKQQRAGGGGGGGFNRGGQGGGGGGYNRGGQGGGGGYQQRGGGSPNQGSAQTGGSESNVETWGGDEDDLPV